MAGKRRHYTDEEALRFHIEGKPGKIEINSSKPMATVRDLSLAYSPGVAAPVRAIAADPTTAYDYTSKGNLVAVISNGTAILGLGDLGPLASKPVMEGKAVLFKRFADVDSIDIEVDTQDPDAFINCVRYLTPTFGGINLEDIKAPDCFIIEDRLRELMDIPVFHDDQHGTAIISAAALVNALHLTGRDIKTARMVVNGAGAAGIACLELIKAMGMPSDNAILCDTKGVIYKGRQSGMNQWKSAHAAVTDRRTLAEAMEGADIFLGLSVKGAVTPDMVRAMAPKPIIFAMANPDPEISPDEVAQIRDDAIMATGRSDYPNQVNNVLGFPYIFRGALDVRARTINEAMKIAAAEALAALAREDVPDEVATAYSGPRPKYGPDYILPVPFDPRLISHVPVAVARAAMESGVAQRPILDLETYKNQLSQRLDPSAGLLQMIMDRVRMAPKRVVFAEGEEETVVRAAVAFRQAGLGTPVLIGREDVVTRNLRALGPLAIENIEIYDVRTAPRALEYADLLYARLQRKGFLHRDCVRMTTNDRNIFGASMVLAGHADAMVTGVTRSYAVALQDVRRVVEPRNSERVIGVSLLLSKGRIVFVADTSVHEMPSASEIADIAEQTARVARRLGTEPRVAFVASSNFGHPPYERSERIREAVEILDGRGADFAYDGEMSPDVALSTEARQLYPFSRLAEPANVLIMPAVHSAAISTKLVKVLGGATLMGPLLIGLDKPVQIAPLMGSVNDIMTAAAFAAYDISA